MLFFMDIQQLKDRINIKEAIEYYGVNFNRQGWACCPFHSERTPSFKIHNQYYHCFGCGESGDIIKFVEKYFKLDFKQAIQKLDTDFNLGLTDEKPTSEQIRKRKEVERKRAEEKALEEFATDIREKLYIKLREVESKEDIESKAKAYEINCYLDILNGQDIEEYNGYKGIYKDRNELLRAILHKKLEV